MADWRQIQARIRKAKNAPNAQAKLAELFQRTHDAMVAWELALVEEKKERMEEAARWYATAAQRFRRADWKKKAEEALARLGGAPAAHGEQSEAEPRGMVPAEIAEDTEPNLAPAPDEESQGSKGGSAGEPEAESMAQLQPGTAGATEAESGKKKRRRGRRGGRGRRRKGAAASPALPSQAFAEPSAPAPAPPAQPAARSSRSEAFERPAPAPPPPPEPPRRAPVEYAEPTLPSERTAHGRAGDPALASRMARLESMLRRLVSSPLHRIDQTDEAPAGPGVFLVSDSDQVNSYYVEACQTLRVGLGNLARGGRGSGKGGRGRGYAPESSGLKAKLAEHLGINEAKVAQYMKDHCVVRWIQLDDDAPLLAHFAIAVLRTPLNME